MLSMSIKRAVKEARRRGLFHVLALYIVGAWAILQVASLAFPGWHIPDAAIRYVWFGAFWLFPVAVIFGWRYEMTSGGVRRTIKTDGNIAHVPLSSADSWSISVLALLSLAIVFATVIEVLGMREAVDGIVAVDEVPQNSIAVLPFVNMSDDDGNEYFSDGISEQLLNELARVPELHVAARTSAFYYKGKDELVQKMGEQLGVRTLLEGSVRKYGNKVRITAQLINAEDGYHLWSETYDRELDDIFAVQDDIARAIAETLKVEFLMQDGQPPEQAATDNMDAYDLYLRGLAIRSSAATDRLDRAIEMFQGAIDLDPDFAQAYDALAYSELSKVFRGYDTTHEEAASIAGPLLQTALKLQPDLEEAHATLGLMTFLLGRYGESEGHYKTALGINPNYFTGHADYGLTLVHQSRLKEASAAYLRAQALDPLNANLTNRLGLLLMLMGQFDDGYGFVQKSLAIEPDRHATKVALIYWMTNYGRLVDAVRLGESVLETNPDDALTTYVLIRAYAHLGLNGLAEELLAQARQSMPGNPMIRLAADYFWLATGDEVSYGKFAESEFAQVDANAGELIEGSDREKVHNYGRYLLMRGEYQDAAEMLHWAAGGDDGIASTLYDHMHFLKYLALAYRGLDRHEEADELLTQCMGLVATARDSGWATPVLFVRLAEIYALMGDIENAAENLDIAFQKGWRDLGMLENGLFFRDIQDDAEITRIKSLLREDIDSQQRELQSIDT